MSSHLSESRKRTTRRRPIAPLIVAAVLAIGALGCQPQGLKRDMNGLLPIHHAVQDGDTALAEKLLKEHGQVNTPDLDGVAPLHRAVRAGDLDMAKLLIRYKADINAATSDGWTPLHIATWYKQPEMVKLLLSEGAQTAAKTPDGSTPFQMACQKGLHDVIDTFMMDWPANLASGKPDVDAPDGKGRAPLILAIESGDGPSVTKLLLLGASAICADAAGNTPLHLLVGKGGKFPGKELSLLAEDLLARGAQVNAVNTAGKTPYALALEKNDAVLAEIYASRGGR